MEELDKEFSKDVLESKKCREIVQEILNFGVSQREILKIIHMLSYELEDREIMLKINEIAKEVLNAKKVIVE